MTITVLTKNPLASEQDVAQNTPVSFTLTYPKPPLTLQTLTLLIDGEVAFDLATGFTRPDFSGVSFAANGIISLQTKRLRKFNQGQRVPVSIAADFFDGVTVSPWTYAWSFDTTYFRTVTRDARLQATNLDLTNPRAVIETFRQAMLNALLPARSTASFSVLLLYAVQNSGLSSIVTYLPDSAALAAEFSRLQAGDLVTPEAAYAALSPVTPLFEIFMREIVTIGQALPEEAELLLRAWETGEAVNRVGAAAAGLLYAVPLA